MDHPQDPPRSPSPPGRLARMALLATLALGSLFGAGSYTFFTAHGTSYLSDDPKVCINCHVMREHYDGWSHGSHHAVATCNDCHMPQDNLVKKFWVKGLNGYHHSKAFTTQNFPDPIRIKASNAEVLEANCRRCHADLVHEMTVRGSLGVPTDPERKAEDLHGCVKCHAAVGHGPTR